jgi:hypothetical protein
MIKYIYVALACTAVATITLAHAFKTEAGYCQ